jgi:hypothetical protein
VLRRGDGRQPPSDEVANLAGERDPLVAVAADLNVGFELQQLLLTE